MKTFFHIILLLFCQFFIANSFKCTGFDPCENKSAGRQNCIMKEWKRQVIDRFDDAISYFLQAIYLDSNYVDAYLSLAGVYSQTKNMIWSVEYYEKAIRKDSAATKVL